MGFFAKNKKSINIFMIIAFISNIGISFVVNILSQDPFNLFDTKNIALGTTLIVLVVIWIICNKLATANAKNVTSKHKTLQTAFKDNGGYKVLAEELNSCIKTGNMKKLKDLIKMVDMIEK